jgi:hypothetical protein
MENSRDSEEDEIAEMEIFSLESLFIESNVPNASDNKLISSPGISI